MDLHGGARTSMDVYSVSQRELHPQDVETQRDIDAALEIQMQDIWRVGNSCPCCRAIHFCLCNIYAIRTSAHAQQT